MSDPGALGEAEIFDGPEGASPSIGFRRVSLPPEPQSLARMRQVLLDAASDGAPLLREGLEGFQSWRYLEPLCGSAWAAGAPGSWPRAGSAGACARSGRVAPVAPVCPGTIR
jgi:hypothetical protein